MKEKNNRLNLIKIKNFCSMKDNIKKIRIQAQVGRKYLQEMHPKYKKNS